MARVARQTCTEQGTFKTWIARHGDVSCQFGAKLKLDSQGGKIQFTTTEGDPNQDDFTTQYLRNQ